MTIGWEETLVHGRGEQAATDAGEGLLDRFGELADPRDRRGVRHSFVSLLAIAVAAVDLAPAPGPRSGSSPVS